MKVLIVGLGSIGRRHLANVRRLEPDAEIVVLRREGADACREEGVQTVRSLEAALAVRPTVAIVASPAVFHVRDGLALAGNGVHLLIEKPLSHSLDGVDDLIATARRRSLVLMTGYHLRFSPSLRKLRDALLAGAIGRMTSLRVTVGQYLPDWRPGTDYRRGVSARAELGGGVVLELSHELDYALWLGGRVSEVHALAGRLGDLEIDVEDTAAIALRFDSGAFGSVHLDMLRRPPVRLCEIVGTEGTLSWDGLGQRARLWSTGTGAWTDLHPTGEEDRNAMFLAELEHFLWCVRTGSEPLVTGDDGRRALELALAVKESARAGRSMALAQNR